MRGMGFIPDLLRHAEEDVALRPLIHHDVNVGLLPPGGSISRSREWRHLVDRVSNQGPTNSCVGQFVSNGVYLAGCAQESLGRGPRVARPSAMWSYDVARLKGNGGGELLDLGCMPRDMMFGCQDNGLVSEERYPFNAAEVNERPPFDLDLAGADALLTGYYVVDAGGSFEAMCAALDVGHFPGFALDVYDNFYDASGSEPYDEVEGLLHGSHMVTAVGYRPGASGDGEILLMNSWGSSWGDDGYLWVSARFVRSHYVKHRTVITAAPASH